MKRLIWTVFVLSAILGGCSHVMSEAGLASVDRSIAYSAINKNPEALSGKNVLVGGIIVSNSSSGDVLQLEVAQLELLSSGVPDDLSPSGGRFLALSGELLDPVFYRPGLLVTIIGEIKGLKVQKLAGADYRYPIISAKEIRLFRASDSSSPRPYNPYQNEYGNERYMLRPPGSYVGAPGK